MVEHLAQLGLGHLQGLQQGPEAACLGGLALAGDDDLRFPQAPVEHARAFEHRHVAQQRFAELGKKGVLAIIADSTNAQKPGYSPSEREIAATLQGSIVQAKGRVIISTFSSLITRVQQIIDVARETNRKIYLSGRSMGWRGRDVSDTKRS
jgi:mRNA degradation ribonuclease J1/J2